MTPQQLSTLSAEAILLLKKLISTPSFSKEENNTAEIIQAFFEIRSIPTERQHNNVWVRSGHWRDSKPAILLNSHHDTVRPVAGWTKDPFNPLIEEDKLFGLGSNDAGASLVALIATFLYFYDKPDLPFNLILAATGEEEISGKNGIASILPVLTPVELGIIGEPTQMRMAVAEKGLMVVDAYAKGKAGHAAREEGINSIYMALRDIEWIKSYEFPKQSSLLGKTKMTVTQIKAGTQHNVVPDHCHFVIDVRTNEQYSNQEVFEILQANTTSTMIARSYRLNSSRIDLDHPIVKSGLAQGLSYFGSPTLSDQALINDFPTLKIGCGKSARSHTADEFILLSEIKKGIATYIELLEGLKFE